MFIAAILGFTAVSRFFSIFAVWCPRFYILATAVIVQVMFYRMPADKKMKISGTWSSMMSAEGIFGSKFLLFSMTFMCFTIREITENNNVAAIQTLLLIIGFFPSAIEYCSHRACEKKDDLLYSFNVPFRKGAGAVNISGKIMQKICEILHTAAAVIYVGFMLYFAEGGLFVAALVFLGLLIILQATIMFMNKEKYVRVFFLIQHVSIAAEMLLLFALIPSPSTSLPTRW
jgi:hypothetical protein